MDSNHQHSGQSRRFCHQTKTVYGSGQRARTSNEGVKVPRVTITPIRYKTRHKQSLIFNQVRKPFRLKGNRLLQDSNLQSSIRRICCMCLIWYPVTGSNRRPHPCKGYALPAELTGYIKRRNYSPLISSFSPSAGASFLIFRTDTIIKNHFYQLLKERCS